MHPDNATQGPAWLSILPIFAQNVLVAQELVEVLDDSASRKYVKLSMLRASGLLEGHIAKLSYLLDCTFIDSTPENAQNNDVDDSQGDVDRVQGESNSTIPPPPPGTSVQEKRAVRVSDFDDLFQASWIAEVREPSFLTLLSSNIICCRSPKRRGCFWKRARNSTGICRLQI